MTLEYDIFIFITVAISQVQADCMHFFLDCHLISSLIKLVSNLRRGCLAFLGNSVQRLHGLLWTDMCCF